MRMLLVAVVLLPVFIAFCEEDRGLVVWTEMKTEVAKASEEFLSAFSTKAERDKWLKEIKSRMESRQLQDIALDWFFDHQGSLRSKDLESMKHACMFFALFVETGTPPPLRAREYITRQSLMDLVEHLRSEVAGLKKTP